MTNDNNNDKSLNDNNKTIRTATLADILGPAYTTNNGELRLFRSRASIRRHHENLRAIREYRIMLLRDKGLLFVPFSLAKTRKSLAWWAEPRMGEALHRVLAYPIPGLFSPADRFVLEDIAHGHRPISVP